ncbi:thioredoxin-like protein [Lipomyces japonicus]|uniref:thioredoxin-like protein n=1 Tax=Lipomyces japonicus TaxID=56871 RepID=UPI0034CDCF14
MSIQPRFLAHKLASASSVSTAQSSSPHVVDLYLDYVCPYSAKLFNTVYHDLLPALAQTYGPGQFEFVFRQVVQPWHPASTLVHEAAIAVERLAPAKFWQFSGALFAHQAEFFDTAVYDEARHATYQRLADLAESSVGVSAADVVALLNVPAKGDDGVEHNTGNKVTVDLKLFVRQHRQNSVHVTPTVAVDGIVNNDISSSWTVDQWQQFLATVVKNN